MGESVTFKGSRTNTIGFAALSLALAAFFLWAGIGKSGSNLALGLMFALVAAYYAVPVLRPDSIYLRLDEEGVEIASVLRANLRIKWSEMQELKLATTHKGFQVLKISYSSPKSSTSGRPRVRTIDPEYASPLTEILSTLDAWRERYGAAR